MNGALAQFDWRGSHGEVTFFVVRFLLPSLGVFSGSAHDLGAVSSSVRCRLPDTSGGTGIVHALSTRVCSLTPADGRLELGAG